MAEKDFPTDFEEYDGAAVANVQIIAYDPLSGEPVALPASKIVEDYQAKIAGKSLSTNDYTNAAVIEVAKITNKQDKLLALNSSNSGFTTSDISSRINSTGELFDAYLASLSLADFNFTMARIIDSRFDNCVLTSSSFISAQIYHCRFFSCNMTGILLNEADLYMTNFYGCTFSSSDIATALADIKLYDGLKLVWIDGYMREWSGTTWVTGTELIGTDTVPGYDGGSLSETTIQQTQSETGA